MKEVVLLDACFFLDTDILVSTEDADKVYNVIKKYISDRKVILALDKCKYLLACFVGSAIGQLYNGDYDFKLIEDNLQIDCKDEDRKMIDLCIENAKKYYENPEMYDRIFHEVVECENYG